MVCVRIVYAEKSLRPMPTELTYVTRAPLREYDYYAILANGCNALPLLIEVVSDVREFGAKTAIDKNAGVNVPVVFVTEDRNVPNLNVDWYLVDRSAPSLSAWNLPLVYRAPHLVIEAERLSMYSVYPQLVVREFWEEIAETSLFHAPSTYYRYIVRQLITVLSNVSKVDKSPMKLAWRALLWRALCEEASYWGLNIHECEQAKPDTSIRDIIDELHDLSIRPGAAGIKDCENIVAFIPIQFTSEIRESIRIHGLKLHPSLASLIAPLHQLLAHIGKIPRRVSVALIHDVSRKDEKIISSLALYTVATLGLHIAYLIAEKNRLQSDSGTSKIDRVAIEIVREPSHDDHREGGVVIGAKFVARTQNAGECVEVEAFSISIASKGKYKRLSDFKYNDVEALLRKALSIMISSSFSQYRNCILLIARDAPKQFFNYMLDAVMLLNAQAQAGIYYIYSPEAIPIYIGADQGSSFMAQCIESCIRKCKNSNDGSRRGSSNQSVGGQRSSQDKCLRDLSELVSDFNDLATKGMDTRTIVLYIYKALSDEIARRLIASGDLGKTFGKILGLDINVGVSKGLQECLGLERFRCVAWSYFGMLCALNCLLRYTYLSVLDISNT